ncbi:MAG: serine hydrolase domain-containing protein [Vicinamibacterales bacterium]
MSVRSIRTILCTLLSAFVLTESTSSQNSWPTERWAESPPAAEGLSPGALAKFDAEIAAGKYGFVDGMLVIRHGKIVYDRAYQHEYDKIYGREAAARGPLNAHDSTGPYNYFNPWVRFTIDRPMAQEPGTTFRYNSGATQMLSHIFKAATGTDIEEYAARHLFAPLGIRRFFWKRSPSGLVDTEGGLYLRSHDIAKIAYLFLKNGMWDGKPIVQPEWVKASIALSIPVGDAVEYGFKWWIYPYGSDGKRTAWGGSGLGGQRPLAIPEYDVIVVFTGWNLLPGRRSLSPRVAIDRIVGAIAKR